MEFCVQTRCSVLFEHSYRKLFYSDKSMESQKNFLDISHELNSECWLCSEKNTDFFLPPNGGIDVSQKFIRKWSKI